MLRVDQIEDFCIFLHRYILFGLSESSIAYDNPIFSYLSLFYIQKYFLASSPYLLFYSPTSFPYLTISHYFILPTSIIANTSLFSNRAARSQIQYNNLIPKAANNFIMPKIMVVLMQEQYPFQPSQHPAHMPQSSILVRQTFPTKNSQKNKILAKATFAKNLKAKYLVKLQSILEEQNYIHLQYEFIDSYSQWYENPTLQNKVYEQLKCLAHYLVNIGVKTSFNRSRIGVTQNFMVKYFLGLDFQWDNSESDTQLQEYYEVELQRVFGVVAQRRGNNGPGYEIVPYNYWQQSQISKQECHNRKVSFASIPSRYNRLVKIDQQLHQIKQTHKQPNYIRNFMRSQSSESKITHKFDSPRTIINRINKKYEDRKYSGDLKFTMFANRKLHEKQNDIKSQRGGWKVQRASKANDMDMNERLMLENSENNENNRQQIETNHSKSRIQEMKYQEYLQITQSKKQYFQDFISVLEDDEPQINPIQYGCKSIKYSNNDDTQTYNSYYENSNNYKNSRIFNKSYENLKGSVLMRTDELQRRARQAINNSREAMRKIRAFPIQIVPHQ